jgi:hypothetical protein
MDSATHNSHIASESRPIVSSDSSLSPPLSTDQVEPPSESSPSTNGLTDNEDDITSEDGSDDDEPTSAAPAANK